MNKSADKLLVESEDKDPSVIKKVYSGHYKDQEEENAEVEINLSINF